MNLQVLVSTMNQTDHSLLEKMNIHSDAIVINQCNRNEFEKFIYNKNSIVFISLAERGIGLSRNTALMRASSDICLFADDDVRYIDDYKQVILKEFTLNPKADVIVFNVSSTNPMRKEYFIEKAKRLSWYNCLRYGTYRIAIRTDRIRSANINFSLLFGGGAKYSAGEDSLFMSDCIKKGLHVYASPKVIGTVNHAESTWFSGYTSKYFFDKGVFFAHLSSAFARILCLQFIVRRRKLFKNTFRSYDAYKCMKKGVISIKKGKLSDSQ